MSIDDVRKVLAEVLRRAPHGRLNVAQVGAELRSAFPDFQASSVGYPNLKAMLTSFPDIGVLEEISPGNLIFRSRTSAPRLKSDWFSAITRFEEEQLTWFDLDSQRLVQDMSMVELHPEQFLEIPRFPITRQREMAERWASAQPEQAAHPLLLALEVDDGLKSFLAATRDLGLERAWSAERTDAIVTTTLTWARDHGIDPRILLVDERAGSGPSRPPPPDNLSVQTEDSEVAYRAFLHEAINRMSLAELDQLWIPARLFRLR